MSAFCSPSCRRLPIAVTPSTRWRGSTRALAEPTIWSVKVGALAITRAATSPIWVACAGGSGSSDAAPGSLTLIGPLGAFCALTGATPATLPATACALGSPCTGPGVAGAPVTVSVAGGTGGGGGIRVARSPGIGARAGNVWSASLTFEITSVTERSAVSASLVSSCFSGGGDCGWSGSRSPSSCAGSLRWVERCWAVSPACLTLAGEAMTASSLAGAIA